MAIAVAGTWKKTRVTAFDKDGARHVLNRDVIGTGDDLALS